MTKAAITRAPGPVNLPADAVGFVRLRVDRPERLAFYRADGSLNTTFALDQSFEDVRVVLADGGYRIDARGIVRKSKQGTAR